jgi:hypothetical protein
MAVVGGGASGPTPLPLSGSGALPNGLVQGGNGFGVPAGARVVSPWFFNQRRRTRKNPLRDSRMLVRTYEEKDLDALRRIHAAQGFGYAFPDLANPPFLTKLVLEDSREVCGGPESEPSVVAAALLRLTAEAYLLLDPKAGTPRQRWEWLLGLHAATEQDALRRGLEDVHAWLPPEIAAKFGKRLTKLGWVRDDTWTPYCKRLR